jgi:membrane protein
MNPIRASSRVVKEVGDDDLSGAAAELAYRFFLSLFPFFIFLAALGGLISDVFGVSNPTDKIMNELGSALPADASAVLRQQLEQVVESRDIGLLSFGIVGAIWAASSGFGSLMKAMNRTYEVKETRPIWKRYALAIGMTLLAGGAMLAAFVILVTGTVYGLKIAGEIGLDGALATLFTLARWPVVALFLLAAMAFLYWAAPNVDLPFRWITPGALVFAIVWLVMTYLFGLYVSNFGSYNATYGALGGVVILLIWLYLTSFIILLGSEINAVLAQEEVPEKLPNTPAEGATPETIPEHMKGEASARRMGVVEARDQRSEAQQVPASGVAGGRVQTLLVAALGSLTLWKAMRSTSAGR